ncbi:MAG: pitrilysin family protein, partial [Planctomycetota bacterium]|nr:pitrilysin family protein [Planctomycetota bacterium]
GRSGDERPGILEPLAWAAPPPRFLRSPRSPIDRHREIATLRGVTLRCSLLGVGLSAALGVVPEAWAQQVPVIERTLANGFKVLIVERHDEPTISAGFLVRVGSANERPGITGIAHLFEHMMFKGTPTLGTKDPGRDLEIIAEQERVRGLMRGEEAKMRAAWRRGEIGNPAKPEDKTPRLRDLEVEFKKLIEEQRALLVKNEFDRVYTVAGASGMNAFTYYDMTAYFITVPANKLELWSWMESERLLRPVFREFYAERDVVFEERRMRTESTPLGKFEETFASIFWEAHPYHWPVIGWASDIPAISKRDADAFYATYYAPQNITLMLVGDVKADLAMPQIERYFGRIPPGEQPVPDVATWEPQQNAEKRMNAEAEANPQVDILFHTVPFGHRDSYPLQVLEQLLENRTGRFHKGLVLGREVATETYANAEHRKWAGLFNVGGEARDGKSPGDVEAALVAELDRLQEEEVPAGDLQKVKNNFAAGEYRKLTSNMRILNQLFFHEGFGDWREINESGPKIQAVTAADVQRVARSYLTRENRSVATYTRKATSGAAGEDPDLAGLAPDQLPAIRQILGRLRAETDVARLKEMLTRLEAQGAGGDPKRQQFQRILRKKVEARIAELSAQ